MHFPQGKKGVFLGLAVALAVAALIFGVAAATGGAIGHSTPSTPSMGDFSEVRCGGHIGSEGFTPSLTFDGRLVGTDGYVAIGVTHKSDLTALLSITRLWVDGVEVTQLEDNAIPFGLKRGEYFSVPMGHNRNISVRVSNPIPIDEITFSIAGSIYGTFQPLAVGMALEPECTVTSNPIPQNR